MTGVATPIGPIGFNAISAMEFDSAGILYEIGRRLRDGRECPSDYQHRNWRRDKISFCSLAALCIIRSQLIFA